MFRICVVTGTRAEYGLLKPLLQLLRDDADFCLQIIATGAHLSPEFGYTIQSITNDGFCVTETLEMLLSSDSAVGVTKSLGLACIGFADALNRLNPNLVILLGDRYEILAAAQCALIAGIPIAHLHGGEITEGAIDDSIRHAITKMSALHFASTPNNCKRIVQMGENPHCVFHVGAIGLDNLSPELLATREQLEQDLKLPLTGPVALVTLHPETCASPEMAEEHARTLVSALDHFQELTIIITGANADAGGRRINNILEQYSTARKQKSATTFWTASLGQKRYLSLLSIADVVIGNSSSGIIEAHSAGACCVNIGDRQKGREQTPSVVNVPWNLESIVAAIRDALSGVQKPLLSQPSPYGKPGVAARILSILKQQNFDEFKRKQFFSLKDVKQ